MESPFLFSTCFRTLLFQFVGRQSQKECGFQCTVMLVLLLWRAGIVPHYSESDSITSFELEWGELEASHVGTVIVGDMNVHHVQCLTYSIHTTPADIALRTWAAEHGLRQLVKKTHSRKQST